MHYPDSDITWRITNQEFSVLATGFLIEAKPTRRGGGHVAHMLSVAGPESAVRSVTAHAISRMSREPAILRAVDPDGRLVERFDIYRQSAERYGAPKPPDWARPTPRRLMGSIYEGAAYSRALDARYVQTDGPSHTFVATADDPDDLPQAYYRLASIKLPAPMLPEWIRPIYDEGLRQGTIKELHSYGVAGVLNEWEPANLREAVRVMGICGRLSLPTLRSDIPAETLAEAAD